MLIAFGGNALIKKGQQGTHKEQLINLKLPMRQVDLVMATGGAPMVKSTYSSGTPAYGVGAGKPKPQIICHKDTKTQSIYIYIISSCLCVLVAGI